MPIGQEVDRALKRGEQERVKGRKKIKYLKYHILYTIYKICDYITHIHTCDGKRRETIWDDEGNNGGV